GEKVSAVELAGQPDLNPNDWADVIALRSGDTLSTAKIDQTIAALRKSGKFKDVELDIRPERDGGRLSFILEPAIYFGVYQFPGAERFSYSRLILAANYAPQEPFSSLDIQNAKESLLTFLRRNGYFLAEVSPEVQVDRTNGLANVDFRVTLNRLADFG